MKLDDKTTIPLWSALTAIPMIVVVVLWLGSVSSDGKATASELSEFKQDVKSEMKDILEKVNETNENVAFIRGRMDPHYKQKKDGE